MGIIAYTTINGVTYSSNDTGLVSVNSIKNFNYGFTFYENSTNHTTFASISGLNNEAKDFYFLIPNSVIFTNYIIQGIITKKTTINIIDKLQHYPTTDNSVDFSKLKFKLINEMSYGTLADFNGNTINTTNSININTFYYTPTTPAKIEKIEFSLIYENNIQIAYNVISVIICNSQCNSCNFDDFSSAISSRQQHFSALQMKFSMRKGLLGCMDWIAKMILVV